MKNKFIGEVILSAILIGLLLFFLKPLLGFLPSPMHPFMIPLLVILVIIFAGVLWKERPGDEREQLHTFIASRFAYFAGIALLTIAIIIQHAQGSIDPWLIIAICVMLLAKILGSFYGHLRH
ncbi:MAG TPA: hypothetical protein VLF93_01110 [Candidatus Saccharimonadales bacterium]|nr:hypothetical protein [Candidatus Saccharimonadales bacterium]